jgi:hypothetical protein
MRIGESPEWSKRICREDARTEEATGLGEGELESKDDWPEKEESNEENPAESVMMSEESRGELESEDE